MASTEPIRFSGMNSGMDTESIIEAMLSTQQTRIDNQNKKLTMLEWQQEAYRSVTEKLTNFQNKYFDLLKRDSYIMSPNSFNKFKADVTSTGTNTNGFSVTTSAASLAQTYKVKVGQTATSSTVEGNVIVPQNFKLDFDKAISTAKFTDSEDGSTRTYEFALDITVGSVTKTIDFTADAALTDGNVDMDALKQTMLDSLNTQLQEEFGHSGRVGDDTLPGIVDASGNEWYLQAEMNADGMVDFRVGGNISVSVAENSGNFGIQDLASSVSISASSAVTGTNILAVTVGDTTKKISFEGVSDTYYSSKNANGNEDILKEFNELKLAAYRKEKKLSSNAEVSESDLNKFTYTDAQAAADKNSAALNEALNNEFNADGIIFTVADGKVTATKDGEKAQLSMTTIDGGTLGIAKGTVSNKIANTTKLADLGLTASNDGYSIKINDVEITVGKDANIKDLISAVNKSEAGVTMSYSALTNNFEIVSKDIGSAGVISIEGSDFTTALGLTDESGAMTNYTRGHNAIVEINGEEIYLNENKYTIDGTTFKFTDDVQLGETFTVGVSRNTEDVKELIVNFVNDYNTLIDEVYEHIGKKPKTDSDDNRFEPLTDAEKEAMSEDEIKTWEENAKIGVIYNDSTVSSIMSKLRTNMYNSVELADGSKIGLFSLGIKTSNDYTQHGKLEIDEERLDKMLSENIDAVTTLFTDSKNGLMTKMDSILDSAVKTSGTAEKRGSLIKKAGLATGATAKDNTIYEQMENIRKRLSDLNDRYDAREEYWWSVFTNMESMMSDLNSQSSYFASYLGSATTMQ